ncbi:hypothetical protein HJC23_001192 [Cyclotella cryptica]|uniref:Uncharacterized protein n=1 Tax=Cyclotella cryptica TaxID=29204 RepID=A0ABD3QPB0_9STRA
MKALEKGNRILSRLGEDIPINPSQDALDEQIQQTQSLIRGISESDILNYKLMTDNIKLEAMKFLAHLESITVMIKPSVHPFVTLKMVQLTMLYGLSPVSPIGFVYFGSLLANRGSIRLGHRFTLLAKDLLEKLEAGEVAGEVICVATEVVRFIEPLQAAIESLAIQGESAAMAGGDIRWACINRLQYCTMMFWACPSLSVVYDKFCEASRFMKEQHHRASLSFMLPFQETTLILMGCETKAVTEDELSSSSHESRSPRHVMLLSFMLENHSMLKEYAEILPEVRKSPWFLYFSDAARTLIVGLIAFQFYRETRDPLWLERGKKCRADMKVWAEEGSLWNFQHKLLLLEAEEHYSNGNFDNAPVSYTKSIASAKAHKFIGDEALACELAAKFYLNSGNLAASLDYFRLAHEKYHEWGALAKANRLFTWVNKTFNKGWFDNSALLSSTHNNVGVMDSQSPAEMDSRKRRAA